MSQNKMLITEEKEGLLEILESRFLKNMHRHPNLVWENIAEKLKLDPSKLLALHMMEATGGEPDVVSFNEETKEYLFIDCSAETPTGRRGICYDQEALNARKANKPHHSAKGMAESMGVKLLTEAQYFSLQTLGDFDTKTSSWLDTPIDIRKKGGAIFGDKRYGRTFIYHNGADSYYAVRGFRSCLWV
ncbi:DUF4256 domain-containing protein [Cecembia calidifontis]|jgi:hypothetical protein|uniref:Uncharacterized protein DUF4256 n=1 Tax=Cecembia calidifontis TaxID=1187080 RepID=A0A4Q7P9U3_9BACT|nr:DUF4256 domain-containing protein [Cecembia calidifontis]RZS95512.1 uncharacterized protein DUF4256 [Cecembia calidifontis]